MEERAHTPTLSHEQDHQDPELPVIQFAKRKRSTQPNRNAGFGTAILQDFEAGSDHPTSSADTRQIKSLKSSRKAGIAYGSTAPESRAINSNVSFKNHVVAVVPNDRFVKPTAPLAMAADEDKHMSAYIDAQMANLQSVQQSDKMNSKSHNPIATTSTHGSHSQAKPDTTDLPRLQPGQTQKMLPLGRRTDSKRRRNKRHEPSEADIERDRRVERIMNEAALRKYNPMDNADASAGHVPDNDISLSMAFKKEFLADLEEKAHARRQASSTQNMTTGPKPGGSRADREKKVDGPSAARGVR